MYLYVIRTEAICHQTQGLESTASFFAKPYPAKA
jgi:hypothetical protein